MVLWGREVGVSCFFHPGLRPAQPGRSRCPRGGTERQNHRKASTPEKPRVHQEKAPSPVSPEVGFRWREVAHGYEQWREEVREATGLGGSPQTDPGPGTEPGTCRARAGRGDTCLGTTRRGLGGKEWNSVTRNPGSQAPRRRRLSVIRGGMPAGALSPMGTGDLLATWAALRTGF